MSTENISIFFQAVAADPKLQEKIRAIRTEAEKRAAEAIALLSVENGTPFTPEEFAAAKAGELSIEQLDNVSGGEWPGGVVVNNWR